ncbi:hypothetical protein H9P43_008818 [Blastocladiella emersonii ATCC 22665]|nr:hypothetical protein H9P43_008818 [Blastocladiella emersonii ATCC 22665]
MRRVSVTVRKEPRAISPTLGLSALIPRFASFPVRERGPPVSEFMTEVSHATFEDDMYTRSERPRGAGSMPQLPSLFHHVADRGGACVFKIGSNSSPRGVIAVLFVHQPIVIPPQGKAVGITPALDVSYVYVPPLPSKSAPAAARASGQKLRKLIKKTENAYVRASEARIPTVDGLGEIGDAIGEYLESCRAATVDREIPDINRFPQTKPGSQKVAPAVATAFASLKSELKRALLLPLFPTYFDNCPQPGEDDYGDEYYDSGDDY